MSVGDGTIITIIGEGDDFFFLCYHGKASSSIGRRMVRGSATDICHTGKRRHLPLASEATVAFLSFQFTTSEEAMPTRICRSFLREKRVLKSEYC